MWAHLASPGSLTLLHQTVSAGFDVCMAVLAGAILSGGVDNMLCAVRIGFMCDQWFV